MSIPESKGFQTQNNICVCQRFKHIIRDISGTFVHSMNIKKDHSVQMYSTLMQITKTNDCRSRERDIKAKHEE